MPQLYAVAASVRPCGRVRIHALPTLQRQSPRRPLMPSLSQSRKGVNPMPPQNTPPRAKREEMFQSAVRLTWFVANQFHRCYGSLLASAGYTVDDLFQIAAMGAWKCTLMYKGMGRERFTDYCAHAVRGVLCRLVRDLKRQCRFANPREFGRPGGGEAQFDVADPLSLEPDDTDTAPLADAIASAMSDLAPEQRALVEGHLAGRGWKEMGQPLGLSAGAMVQRLGRAHEKLRRRLLPFAPRRRPLPPCNAVPPPGLSPCAQDVWRVLAAGGPMKADDILVEMELQGRTWTGPQMQWALMHLRKAGAIVKSGLPSAGLEAVIESGQTAAA